MRRVYTYIHEVQIRTRPDGDKKMARFTVIENGPDSFDYVVGVFNDDKSRFYNQWGMTGEQKAIEFAKSMTDRYAYLGYGYTVVAS